MDKEIESGTPIVIGIAGGSASGKTTFSRRLEKSLADRKVEIFHMDEYFKPEKDRPHSRAFAGDRIYVDDNHPETMDLQKLYQDIKTRKESREADVILVEGLLTLYDDQICGLLDLKLFVDCRADERILRRLKRNMEMGLSSQEITDVYLDLVRYRHDQYVEPSKWRADMILNGSGDWKKAVSMVKNYLPLLKYSLDI